MVRVGLVLLRMMRSVRVEAFGGPEVLTVQNIPIPSFSATQVLVKVEAVGVNPVETYIRAGNYSRLPQLPYTPGNDASGIVSEVGNQVQKFQDSCWLLPNNLSFSEGAAIGTPYFTAYRALFLKCHAKPSKSVLVHGASGAVGLAAVQFGRAHGLKVLGTAGSDEGLKLVKEAGAHHIFNHKNANHTTQIQEVCDNKGVDIILEMLSNVNLGKDLELVGPNGIIAVIGCRGSVEINPRLTMGKESSIIGVGLLASTPCEWEEMGAAVKSGLEGGWLRPVVDKEYPLELCQEAHRDVIHSKGAKGKLILRMSNTDN